MNRLSNVIRLEWAAAAATILLIYGLRSDPWWVFLALILVPDLSMLGYMAGSRLGAICYNLFHVSVWAVGLIAAGAAFGGDWPIRIGLIWLAHIAIDRALGYGLKMPSGFKDTHLGRLGAPD